MEIVQLIIHNTLYSEMILRSIFELEGIRVGGENINNIRYADDTVLIADSEQNLQELLNVANRASEQNGLKININKTETLVVSKNEVPVCSIRAGDQNVKQVDSFKYLGSLITSDGRCIKEIKKRIAVAKTSFLNMKTLLCNLKMSMRTRIKALKTYIWSVLTYGCEAWTLSKEAREKLEAFEMWTLRRMMRIP